MLVLALYSMLTTFIVEINSQAALHADIVTLKRYNEMSTALVECDITKFKSSQITEKPYLMALGVQRKLRTSQSYTLMAAYQPNFAPEHRKFLQTPAGESWDASFSGGDGWNNRNTMKVVVTINSLDCVDSGLYRCYFHPPGTPYVTYSDPYNFTACGKGENDLVKLKRSRNDLTVVVECDVAKFKDSQISVKPYLMELGIQRKLSNQHNYTLMAAYQPYYAPQDRKFAVIPPGHRWSVNFTGGEGWLNKNTMKVVIHIQQADCKDSGLYRCYFFVPSETQHTFSEPYNLTVKPLFEIGLISMSPKVGTSNISSTNNVGVSVQMRCTAKGAREIKLIWTYMRKNFSTEQTYPPAKDIASPAPTSIGGSPGCITYQHSSILRFRLAESDDGKTYFCRAHYLGVIEGKVQFTVHVNRKITALLSGGERVAHHVTVLANGLVFCGWWRRLWR